MDYENTKRIFIFADESGDTGDPLVYTDCSENFTINIAIATDRGVESIEKLISGFKFFNNYTKELKDLKSKNLEGLMNKISFLSDDVKFYETVIHKRIYNGPYLRDSTRYSAHSLWFRNFILMKALEYITISENLYAANKDIELIIDRYTDSTQDSNNLREYLANVLPNDFPSNIPKILPSRIVFLNSQYCLQIQLLDLIQKFKDKGHAICHSVPTDYLHI